jgi:two-component system chemotaxis response regulator CheY
VKKCLIVDDSAVVRKLARMMVEGLGFSCDEAPDGLAALEYCGKAMPVLILLDWNMPVMDGMEFMKALRANPSAAGVKIIFCTTENNMPAIAAALDAGADEYIMKPFDVDILHSKIRQVGLG